MNSIIEQTVAYVQHTLAGDATGHDWWHIYRVWQQAIRLAEVEGADLQVVQLAALLHDIADWKSHGGDFTVGPRVAGEWLQAIGVETVICEHVCSIIANVSFKGAAHRSGMASIEGKVVQDADRLDALGALGIARTFAFGGSRGNQIYDPAIQPIDHTSIESYISADGPVINHFYEKLLLLKDRLHTEEARRIAEGRHAFMQEFLTHFFAEWAGSD